MERNAFFEQFELQAALRPDAIACSHGGREISYADLNRAANRLAHALGAGSRIVAIFLEPGIEYVCGLLAAGKAGAAFMPLDPSDPPLRIQSKLRIADVKQVVSCKSLSPRLRHCDHIEVITKWTAGPETNPGLEGKPTDPSYVMFTSGSTGTPKAILGQQRGLSHFLRWEIGEFGIDENSRVSWLAPPTFDVSLRDILIPLMSGGRLCIPDAETSRTPRLLVQWLASNGVTLMHCVPTLFRLITREIARTGASLPALRHVLIAGEPLHASDIAEWRRVAGESSELINLYGPSETTLAKLFYRIGELPPDLRSVLPVGRPLPNTAVLILKDGQLCATGQIGEIHIQTRYRSLGYLGEQEMTARAFIPNPVDRGSDEPLYRTGDLGRVNRDGLVECLGRTDGQLKIRGIRIEPGEIESAVRSLPGIGEVAVTAHQSSGHESTLVCYVAGVGGSEPDADAIRTGLAEILPAALHPQIFVPLPELPKTLSGKLNRKALPRPEALLYERRAYVAPEGDIEQRLCRIWSELFGIEKIGVETSFTEFGGDSLKSIRAVARIYDEFAVEISLRDFFGNPTIRSLGKLTGAAANPGRPELRIEQVAAGADYPLSAVQARLWTLDRMGAAPTAYNLSEAYLLNGPLDVAALEHAFQAVIARHESLRTSFIQGHDSRPRQVVHRQVSWSLEQVDAESLATAESMTRSLALHHFDLSRPTQLRVVLIRLPEPDRHILHFNIHHIISDVWSLDILVREVAAFYRGAESMPALHLQYRDYAAWQDSWLKGNGSSGDRDFWHDRMTPPLPVLELPPDFKRPPMQTFRGSTLAFDFAAENLASLDRFRESRKCTRFAAVTAITAELLRRLTGQQELVIGTPVAGRTQAGVENLIGCFINELALRLTLDDRDSLSSLATRIAQCVNESLQHQSFPFDSILGEFGIRRDISRAPVFDVMVVLQPEDSLDLTLDGIVVSNFGARNDWNFSRYDLVFHFMETATGLRLDLNYNSDLFQESRIARVGNLWVEIARSAALAPDAMLENLTISPKAETVLLRSWGEGQLRSRAPATMASLFSDQARRTPDALAALSGARIATFAEMHRDATRISASLSRDGVRRGDRVAVISEPTIESLTAMLGALYAGAVYVPIDAALPRQRREMMIESAECNLVLNDSEIRRTLEQHDEGCVSGGSDQPPLPADPAYVIFTSGSTGQPKPVLLAHGGFANMTLGQIETFGITPQDRVLQFASPGFDASLANIYMAWAAGAAVVTIPRASIEDQKQFLAHVERTGTTVVTLPPTYLHALDHAALSPVRILISAGEPAIPRDLAHYAKVCRVFNAYGPTEISVCASIAEVTPNDYRLDRIPIGRPLPNVEILIVNRRGDPIPAGAVGEMVIGGPGVAIGYLGDAEATAARFPTRSNGARYYRTGDLARWREDGALDFLGRTDDQLKINGQRLEPGEVEAAFRTLPDISDAHVAGIARGDGSTALAAWYVPRRCPEFWPSVAEFYVYDDVLYGSMAADEQRNERYRAAFRRHLRGKTVLEIGPGPLAVLSRMAIEEGAKKVYAVELLASTYEQARRTIAEYGLQDRIILIHGDAREIELPEPADICISEIVGAIGGSEGAGEIINSVRRLLKNPSEVLPQRSLTRVAAVALPDSVIPRSFDDIAAGYVDRIFAEVDRPFDLRICVKNLPADAIISTSAPFEELDFTRGVPAAGDHAIALEIEKSGLLTGFIAWLTLEIDDNNRVDILESPGSWLPVYLQVFDTGVAVNAGDRIVGKVRRRLSRNGLNPDFFLDGELLRAGMPPLRWHIASPHCSEKFGADPLIRELFPKGEMSRRPSRDSKIRSGLSSLLPAYAIPSLLVTVDHLPVTANGKVDRAALPLPMLAAATVTEDPPTPLESRILDVWREVLMQPQLGKRDPFFSFGGDSIRAIQVLARLQAIGLKAEIRHIFEHPTVEGFANCVRAASPRAGRPPVSGPVPLTPIQQWFFATITEAPELFVQCVLVRWPDELDSGAANHAVNLVWHQHDALRARFPNAAAAQLIMDGSSRPGFAIVDPQSDPDWIRTALEGMDLVEGPLFRAVLARGAGECGGDAVLLVAHHLVVDAVSWRILVDDLVAAYKTVRSGAIPAFPPMTLTMSEFAGMLQQLPEPAENEIASWLRLASVPALSPPRASSSRSAERTNSATFGISIPSVETSALLNAARSDPEGGVQVLLIAALGYALRSVFGCSRVLIAVESHGREEAGEDFDLSRTVGWFTTFHPMLLEIPDLPPHDLITGTRSNLAEVRGQGRAFLRALPRLGRDAPVPSVGFNFLGSFGRAPTAGTSIDWDPAAGTIELQHPRIHLLDILVAVIDDALEITITYDTDRFSPKTIGRVASAWRETLALLSSPDADILHIGAGRHAGFTSDQLENLLAGD